jgi:hypothetical protein
MKTADPRASAADGLHYPPEPYTPRDMHQIAPEQFAGVRTVHLLAEMFLFPSAAI